MEQQQTSSGSSAADAMPSVPTILPHLPLETLEHICSSLQLEDRVALTSCCRVLWACPDVLCSPALWGELQFQRPNNLTTSSIGPAFAQSLAVWLWRRRAAVRRLAYDGQLGGLTAILGSLVGCSMEALALSQKPSCPPLVLPASRPMLPQDAFPQAACLTALEALQLKCCDLSSLPVELLSLPNLRSLALANNRGLRLDRAQDAEVLQGLTALSHLSARGCALTTFPPALSVLTNLEDLDLSRNAFGSCPLASQSMPALLRQHPGTREYIWVWTKQEFWHLQHLATLTRLDLSDCDLSVLPPQLSCLTGLSACELRGNHLLGEGEEAWEAFAPLQLVPSLTRLNLGGCLLRRLPELSALTNLVELDLSTNWLQKGGEGALEPLLQLTALRRLEIQNGGLQGRPAELLALEERGVEVVFERPAVDLEVNLLSFASNFM